jgi:predicted transcriptional regulator
MTRRPDGALETDVLRVLWSADRPLLPGEINERLDAGYAYTSVATILTRLQAKGLVVRSPAGRAYAYQAAVDEAGLAVRRISELLDSSSDRAKVLSRFITGLSPRESKDVRALLDTATSDISPTTSDTGES